MNLENNWHTNMSIIKSIVRIAGFVLLLKFVAFAVGMLILAELIGVIEEFQI
jgi:hypothetical protein